jgi:hypothetical protein
LRPFAQATNIPAQSKSTSKSTNIIRKNNVNIHVRFTYPKKINQGF